MTTITTISNEDSDNRGPSRNSPAESSLSSYPGLTQSILTEADWDDLADIYAESFSGPPWFEDWNRAAARETFAEYRAKGADFIVKFDGDAAVASSRPVALGIGLKLSAYEGGSELETFGVSPAAYYIADLCTAPQARGRGLCTQMVQDLLERAAELKCPEAVSRTRTDNLAMIGIFERMGFELIGSYPAQTGGIFSTRVVYRADCQ